ncbi:MAG: MBL fold metallo-hydrolase [Pseudomonadota bacterium]|nr:MBL fold metallo-hydrolase [Pseudomonadota bacterium]
MKTDSLKLTFYGAAREVTGSCHLLETAHIRLLLECGLHQGDPEAERRNRAPFPFEPSSLKALVLSHAHLDHSGLIPRLVAEGFSGPIYCTRQTRDLLGIMLKDAAYLQERDVQWENKRRERAGRPLLRPLYTQQDVGRVLALCEPVVYGEHIAVAEGLRLRFLDAGHILGSAIVELDVRGEGRHCRLAFSGDLGNPGSLLMKDPQVPQEADLVVMEATYGDRDHKDMDTTQEELAQILALAHAAGGNVLIPAFSVGRTQEVIYQLAMLRRQGRLPQPRVYLDSPMAIDVTALYLGNLAALDRKDIDRLTDRGRHSLTEVLEFLRPTRTTEESMALNRIQGGAVIIAGSGMCEGGRIRHHLKYNLWRRQTQVVIVGFQARGTLGRRLVDGAQRVKILGGEIAVRAGIHTLGGYSAHAGREQLLDWAEKIPGSPRICLVHGEEVALAALADGLAARTGRRIEVPRMGETIEC